MKIGLVCPYDLSKPGGVQAQVKDLAEHLTEGGDEVLVIGPGLPEGLRGVDLGASISIPGNRSRVPLSPDPRVGRHIQEATGDVDLLHVHEPLMPTVSLSALRAGPPVVATFHASPGPIGAGFYSVAGSQLGRLLGPNVRRVTAVSRTATRHLTDHLDIKLIPNGVNVDSFALDIERLRSRVAFLGRDEKRKGLDVLLRAWEQVAATIPNAELLVMGADRGTDGVRWLGPVDEADKREGLASSAIYVAPNLGGESFGIVLVEAMAAGAAVVASDLDAFRDVGGDAARFFATGDGTELAEALIELLQDPAGVETMSRAGRDRSRRFDWSTITYEYRKLYEQALS